MPIYRNKDRTILLVHIPKTGGSSLEEMLVDAGAEQALKFHKRLGYSASTPQHMHWEVLCRWIPRSFYNFSLTIVRNPFDRLASEYAWRLRISVNAIPEFNTWLRDTLVRYEKNPYVYDNHMRPQVDFVGPRVKVFKLEDGLNPAAKTAFRRLGLTYRAPQTPHVRKSKHKMIQIEETTLALVRRFYAADFAVYEYDPAIVPEHLFEVIADPTPEPELPIVEVVAPTPPLWRQIGSKIKRRIKAAIKQVVK